MTCVEQKCVISKRFMGMIGVDRDVVAGEVVEIRGKKYRFPSSIHVYDITRGGKLSEYEVE